MGEQGKKMKKKVLQRTSQVIVDSSVMSARETRVDVESNTSGWNQTCKNLIRFLQDRISNKKEGRRKVAAAASAEREKIFIQIKLMIFLLLLLFFLEGRLVERDCE